MKNEIRKYQILTIVLLLVCVFVSIISTRKTIIAEKINLNNIPLVIDGWQGKDIDVAENVKGILETEGVFMREYTRANDKIGIAIVYYKESEIALHLPESCADSMGTRITKRGLEPIDLLDGNSFKANKIFLNKDGRSQIFLYYYSTGKFFTSSYLQFRLRMAIRKVQDKLYSGALVRFSIPVTTNEENALRVLKEFMSKITPLLPAYLI